jgi:hypothetical protein
MGTGGGRFPRDKVLVSGGHFKAALDFIEAQVLLF